MKPLTRFKFFLWYFSRFKVPLIGYLKPHLLKLTDKEVIIRMPLGRKSKNHLNSMYFGALAIGADVACGLHAFYHANQAQIKISLLFKSFQAQFLQRAESDVYFVCEMGEEIKEMITEALKTLQRVNRAVKVKAFVNCFENSREVAEFTLELSLKVKP